MVLTNRTADNDAVGSTDEEDRLFGGGAVELLIRCGDSDHLDFGGRGTAALGDFCAADTHGRYALAARRQSVLNLIARRSSDPSFHPAQAAEHLGMSVRYLHRLLEPTGRTFSKHLIEQRLARAFDMLRDQHFAHLRIDAVARHVGFSDISHFNRSFRHAFGDTPYGVRVRAARERG
jgi:AraC-like DNA-binding protein